jgi:hypothetical protein
MRFVHRIRERERVRTLRRDGIPWNIRPIPQRIVATGDVHGDLEALGNILYDRDLVDKKGRWTGGDAHLVLTGDLVGGPNARLLLHFVSRLEEQAAEAGGAVHPLLGNHDIQVFNEEYEKRIGKSLFAEYPVTGALDQSPVAAFQGDASFAAWLRGRNTIIRIGGTIFAHAGLNTWALHHHPARINATVRAWIRHWQGVDVEPDRRTLWAAMGAQADWSPSAGPLWTRSYKVKNGSAARIDTAPAAADVALILKKYRAARMVIGHNPVAGGEILLSHPEYGDHVVMIDTAISDSKRGALSCLEIRGEDLETHYPKRRKVGGKICGRELKRLKKRAAKQQ